MLKMYFGKIDEGLSHSINCLFLSLAKKIKIVIMYIEALKNLTHYYVYIK